MLIATGFYIHTVSQSSRQLTDRKYCLVNVYLLSEMYFCFLIGVFKLFTTYGWDWSYWSGGGWGWGCGVLRHCGYWQVEQLHQAGPGEVPVTCFIPTVVPCHKKARGSRVTARVFVWSWWKKSFCGPDCVSALSSCVWREHECAEKQAAASLYRAQTGARVLVK